MNKIEFIDPPLWQVQRLAKWLNEWDLEMTLRKAKAEGKFADEEPSEPLGLDVRNLVDPFDENVLFGEIRLLSSQLVPEARRPVYVAIISDWMEGVKLVAPYGVFSEPASSGELLTGREHSALQVLCLWNSHTIPGEIIAKSWVVDRMARSELEGAWATFEHVTFGHSLPDSIIQRVGPPITNRLDPRCQYQEEELSMMAPLARAAIEWMETKSPQVPESAHSRRNQGLEEANRIQTEPGRFGQRGGIQVPPQPVRQSEHVAFSAAPLGIISHLQFVATALNVSVVAHFNPDPPRRWLVIWNQEGSSLSALLDGCRVLVRTTQRAEWHETSIVESSKAELPSNTTDIRLTRGDGTEVELKPVT